MHAYYYTDYLDGFVVGNGKIGINAVKFACMGMTAEQKNLIWLSQLLTKLLTIAFMTFYFILI